MRVLKLLMLIFLISYVHTLTAQNSPYFVGNNDPKPAGKTWQKVGNLSDEFNNNSFDGNKWTKNIGFLGKKPSVILASQVSEGNGPNGTGCLRIRHRYLNASERANYPGRNYAGGAVRSKKDALPGYYMECKMRASHTFMSSSFWLFSDCTQTGPSKYRRTELDIQETVGTGNSNSGKFFTKHMVPNTWDQRSNHHHCNNASGTSNKKWEALGGKSSDRFYTYGAWWKSPTKVLIFLDGKHIHTITPPANFNLPMHLRMISHAYPWNPPSPNDGMGGSQADRTVYYDWVRTWKLTGSNSNSDGDGDGGGGASIPGTIQAENYSAQSGVETMPTSDNGGGRNVRKIDSGDYMNYNVSVAQASCYNVKFRVASKSSNIKLKLERGSTQLLSINSPSTGGWQTWKTVTKKIWLPAGNHTLKVKATGRGWNFNWMKFELANCGSGKLYTDEGGILSAYPNPMGISDHLFIDVELPETNDIEVAVFDIQGKQIYTQIYNGYDFNGNTIVLDVNATFRHQKGIYIVRVTSGSYRKAIKVVR